MTNDLHTIRNALETVARLLKIELIAERLRPKLAKIIAARRRP